MLPRPFKVSAQAKSPLDGFDQLHSYVEKQQLRTQHTPSYLCYGPAGLAAVPPAVEGEVDGLIV